MLYAASCGDVYPSKNSVYVLAAAADAEDECQELEETDMGCMEILVLERGNTNSTPTPILLRVRSHVLSSIDVSPQIVL